MDQPVATARMAWPERLGLALGLTMTGAVAGAAAALAPGHSWLALFLGLPAGLVLTHLPGWRLRYHLRADHFQAGAISLPYAGMRRVRLILLKRTTLLPGISLPGYRAGRAIASGTGRVWLMGSTGLGSAVLIEMNDGRRVAVTPADPVGLLVRLEARREAPHGTRGG